LSISPNHHNFLKEKLSLYMRTDKLMQIINIPVRYRIAIL
jgi:hypothetical protein